MSAGVFSKVGRTVSRRSGGGWTVRYFDFLGNCIFKVWEKNKKLGEQKAREFRDAYNQRMGGMLSA